MKKTKKLQLNRQTIARLNDQRLRHVVGGGDATESCGPTGCCGNGNQSLPPRVCNGEPTADCTGICDAPVSAIGLC